MSTIAIDHEKLNAMGDFFLKCRKKNFIDKTDLTDLVNLVQISEKKFFFHFFRIKSCHIFYRKERTKKRTKNNFQHNRTTRASTGAILRKKKVGELSWFFHFYAPPSGPIGLKMVLYTKCHTGFHLKVFPDS